MAQYIIVSNRYNIETTSEATMPKEGGIRSIRIWRNNVRKLRGNWSRPHVR